MYQRKKERQVFRERAVSSRHAARGGAMTYCLSKRNKSSPHRGTASHRHSLTSAAVHGTICMDVMSTILDSRPVR